MVPRNTIRSFLSLILIVPMMLLTSLGACSKSKKTAVDAAGLAPIQGTSDASASSGDEDSDEASSSLENCDKDDELESGDDQAKEDEDDGETELAPKADKPEKGKKSKKDCPVPPTAGTGTTAGTASLAEGQKLYTANCQSCHGALPGEKQGSSATEILNASGVGAHKNITPWPAGAGSTLSAQDAAASLAEAMK